MKCKKKYCEREIIRADGEFGRCIKCGTIYRFDESGYYYANDSKTNVESTQSSAEKTTCTSHPEVFETPR